jgi:glutamate synthase (NADPH/NADH) small chain
MSVRPLSDLRIPEDRPEKKFHDHSPLLSDGAAHLESARCLYCRDAPCIRACPTAIDIPEFIRKIGSGNFAGSARTILKANLLGASCARVCPVDVLCEGSCVYVPWGRTPIRIGRLQRYAMEKGTQGTKGAALLEKAAPSGKSVGLVGGGPASLACAGKLVLLGHAATIYEKDPWPGGLNASGVAPYKFQMEDAMEEARFIRELGVEFQNGMEVGVTISPAEILARHDAVFLGIGLGGDSRLGVPGEEGPGVFGATDWIRRMKTGIGFQLARVNSAVVVGGGNTSVDVARELRGLGIARVTLLARRSPDDLRAYAHEVAQAREEGVIILGGVVIERIVRAGDRVVGVRFASAAVAPVPRAIEADLVVVATGQARLVRLASSFPGVVCDPRGRIVADRKTGETGNPRVFAGGDARNGGKEVVHAAAEGQAAARAIDRMLRQSMGEGNRSG